MPIFACSLTEKTYWLLFPTFSERINFAWFSILWVEQDLDGPPPGLLMCSGHGLWDLHMYKNLCVWKFKRTDFQPALLPRSPRNSSLIGADEICRAIIEFSKLWPIRFRMGLIGKLVSGLRGLNWLFLETCFLHRNQDETIFGSFYCEAKDSHWHSYTHTNMQNH